MSSALRHLSRRSLRRMALAAAVLTFATAASLQALSPDTVFGPLPKRPYMQGTRLYFGMWSTHFRYLDRGLKSNQLIALSHRGYYGGTFINSFGDRAVTAGIQRHLLNSERASSAASALGYRAGLITGYDERFLGIAGKVPVLPFVQLLGGVDFHRVGVEFAYAGVVGSVAVNYRF